MTDSAWPVIEATKLDAARRQLDVAIRLLFAREDALAVHTLAHAAFGVLKGIAKYRGVERVLKSAAVDASQWPKDSGNYLTEFNRVANFLKHGDKDPIASLTDIPEEINEALIFCGTEIYSDLGAIRTPEIEAFALWYHAIHFVDIENVEEPFISWVTENADHLHAENRKSLLVIGNDLLQRLQIHHRKKSRAAT